MTTFTPPNVQGLNGMPLENVLPMGGGATMKRILAVLVAVVIAASILPGFARASLTPPVDKDGAIEILMKEIIKPSSASHPQAAYMLSKPLQAGDVVSSTRGTPYPIAEETWFIFIEGMPRAAFAHPVSYVFIDVQTGVRRLVPESWPPLINDYSLGDKTLEALGKGQLIKVYSILGASMPMPDTASTAPRGDYGDAPDGQGAYWAVVGRFPTLFATLNSLPGRPGAHALNVGQEMLGVKVSAEVDATDPADPDGVPNLVDADSDERMFVIIEGATAKLCFDVTVAAAAPDMPRYVNALLDFAQNGKWNGQVNGKEWAVVNLPVNVGPGTTATICSDIT